MDAILSEFITRTSSDPGLARDLLESHKWNLQSALSAYYILKGITVSPEISITNDKRRNSTSRSPNQSPKNQCSSPGKSTSPANYLQIPKSPEREVTTEGSTKRLSRGISRATDNVNLVSKARSEFAQDFRSSGRSSSQSQIRLETPVYTFTLPDLSIYPEDFRAFLERDLIETSTLVSLEQAGRLNWWADRGLCQRLWPLATTGDGNCLLHAASLGMWGFHDRLLTLRKALHSILSNSAFTQAFYRRWRWQTSLQNKEAGLVYCEEEWSREWQSLLKLASTEPRLHPYQKLSGLEKSETSSGRETLESVPENKGQSDVYESLEEIHVLALAHVLKRPIIVIADTMLKDATGQPFAPIPFGGIYLPLECPLIECHRSPLCLTYDAAHFSALVAMDMEGFVDKTPHLPAAIPLVDPENKILPIQFAVDPGPDVRWNHDENDFLITSNLQLTNKEKLSLLNDYLDLSEIPLPILERQDSFDSTPDFINGINEEVRSTADSFDSDDSIADTASASSTGSLPSQQKSKAAKQIQTVAKQFGSIGKTMSKKLKKNFGSLTRKSGSFKGESDSFKQTMEGLKKRRPKESPSKLTITDVISDQILVASLHTEKRHEYQEEMIKNYLISARSRFNKEKESKYKYQGKESKQKEKLTYCINPGCTMFGTSATSYLCSSCYSKQKQQEVEMEGKRKYSPVHKLLHKDNCIDDDSTILRSPGKFNHIGILKKSQSEYSPKRGMHAAYSQIPIASTSNSEHKVEISPDNCDDTIKV
ncbi:OTU domain-containing protein 7B-like isoform X2 [Centruroides vittatus]|uniref:OTU domain-containing protein 7B-like isoform X2 n=1 Tax=Centruroides vittatus TaxID=120091 RepID=UPI00350F3C19